MKSRPGGREGLTTASERHLKGSVSYNKRIYSLLSTTAGLSLAGLFVSINKVFSFVFNLADVAWFNAIFCPWCTREAETSGGGSKRERGDTWRPEALWNRCPQKDKPV